MTRELRRAYLPFFIFIAALFLSVSVAQATPTSPTIAEIRAAYEAGALNSSQANILIAAINIAAEYPGFTYERKMEELTADMGYIDSAMTIALYADAVNAITFAQTIRNTPRIGTVQAYRLFHDSPERVADYIRTFGASTNPAIQADIARLALIYDPATNGSIRLGERRAAELVILSRDPETLLPQQRALLATEARERYGTNITVNSIQSNWYGFMRRITNPIFPANPALTPQQLQNLEMARIQATVAGTRAPVRDAAVRDLRMGNNPPTPPPLTIPQEITLPPLTIPPSATPVTPNPNTPTSLPATPPTPAAPRPTTPRPPKRLPRPPRPPLLP